MTFISISGTILKDGSGNILDLDTGVKYFSYNYDRFKSTTIYGNFYNLYDSSGGGLCLIEAPMTISSSLYLYNVEDVATKINLFN